MRRINKHWEAGGLLVLPDTVAGVNAGAGGGPEEKTVKQKVLVGPSHWGGVEFRASPWGTGQRGRHNQGDPGKKKPNNPGQ